MNQSTSLRLRRQWLLTTHKDCPTQLSEQINFRQSGYTLYHHADCIISNLHETPSLRIISIGAAVRPIVHSYTLSDTDEAHIARILRDLAGCYAVIIERNSSLEITGDAAGICGIYFSEGCVASTPTLLTSSIEASPKACFDRASTERPDDWTLGSGTPFQGIKWLFPNHLLNVKALTIRRFWPTPNDFSSIDTTASLNTISKYIHDAIELTTHIGTPLISITGGKDSRINVAASLPRKECFKYFTITSPSIKSCDYTIPVQLTSMYGLDHRFVPAVPPMSDHLLAYDEISGGIAQGARRMILSASQSIASPDAIHINGNLGALCKAYYWPRRLDSTISRSTLLREFSSPGKETLAGLNEWIETLPPELPMKAYYNLMYLEQRAGRWMGPGENASGIFYASFTPLNSRFLFEQITMLAEDYQRSGQLLIDIAECLSPGITKVPYCPNAHSITRYLPRGLRRLARRIKKTWNS